MASIRQRRRKDGTFRYTAEIRIKKKGKVIHSEAKTFSKKSLAKKWSTKREDELSQPGAIRTAQHLPAILGKLIDDYITERQKIKAFGRSKNSALRFLEKEPIAQLDAIELSVQDVMKHIVRRRESGTGATTVGQDIVWLRIVLRYAKRVWDVPLDLQVIDVAAETAKAEKLISRSQKRERRPTYEELEKLDKYFSLKTSSTYPMRLIMWFAIYSTRRQDEITSILKADIDKKHKSYLVRDLKHPDGSEGNHKEATMPNLGWTVLREIEKLKLEGDRLLPFNTKTISAYFTRACKILDIKDLRFHDLRHEGASRLGEDGWTIPQIQQVTLHDSWSSLQVYVNLSTKKKRRLNFKR